MGVKEGEAKLLGYVVYEEGTNWLTCIISC